jgi:hypothetical protein
MQFVFPDYIRRTIILLSEQILEYQVTQLSPDRVRVRLLVSDPRAQQRIAEAAQKGIQQVFASYGCARPRVEVEFGEPVPNSRSLKLIRVHRAFEIEE